MDRILRIVPKVLGVEEREFRNRERIVAAPQNWRDNLFGLKPGELPFLLHVLGRGRLRPDNQQQPIARGDGVANLLMKRQPPRRQRQVIEPDIEPGCRQLAR